MSRTRFTTETGRAAQALQPKRPRVFDRLAHARAYELAKYRQRKQAGLCVACGIVPVQVFERCLGCRARHSARMAQRKAASL